MLSMLTFVMDCKMKGRRHCSIEQWYITDLNNSAIVTADTAVIIHVTDKEKTSKSNANSFKFTSDASHLLQQ